MNTSGITKDQYKAMSLLVRNGRNGPSATGLSVHTYRALVRRGLLHYTGGRGNSSMYAITDDGRQWANEFI